MKTMPDLCGYTPVFIFWVFHEFIVIIGIIKKLNTFNGKSKEKDGIQCVLP